MTVSELKAKLDEFGDDLEVNLCFESEPYAIDTISTTTVEGGHVIVCLEAQ